MASRIFSGEVIAASCSADVLAMLQAETKETLPIQRHKKQLKK
jgi:hypothetical protein